VAEGSVVPCTAGIVVARKNILPVFTGIEVEFSKNVVVYADCKMLQ